MSLKNNNRRRTGHMGIQEVRPAEPPVAFGYMKKVFDDTGAMSNFLKLVQRISDLVAAVWASSPIADAARALKSVTDFISARNIVGRTAELFATGGQSIWWIAGKLASYIGDISSTTGWLASVNVFGPEIGKKILETSFWMIRGKSVTLLKGVGDLSCFASSVLDIADIANDTFREIRTGRYFHDAGGYKVRTMGCHVFSVLGDIARITSVFLNVCGAALVYSACVGIAAETMALVKFYIKNYWAEHALPAWMNRAVDWIHNGALWHGAGQHVPVIA